MLLYGDAVAHLGIARRIIDTNTPGLINWGGVWLPLPHLLMLPFVGKMQWWQNGMAGAWPSLICYVILGCMGMYRLARRVLVPGWALVATAFFGLERQPALPGHHRHDGAAVPRAARLDRSCCCWSSAKLSAKASLASPATA